jgi:nitroreductase
MARVAEHPIDPLFLRRWSPRAMSGAPVTRDALLSLLEAARWSPSGGNSQPWRFVYALRDTPAFAAIFDTLEAGNREWCVRAGALVLLSTQMIRPDGRAAGGAPFACGAAFMAFALQGTLAGLVVHPMGGFDRERIRLAAGIAPGLEPQLVVAVGHPGMVQDLSERNREREQPSGREPVSAWAREGRWA